MASKGRRSKAIQNEYKQLRSKAEGIAKKTGEVTTSIVQEYSDKNVKMREEIQKSVKTGDPIEIDLTPDLVVRIDSTGVSLNFKGEAIFLVESAKAAIAMADIYGAWGYAAVGLLTMHELSGCNCTDAWNHINKHAHESGE